MSTRRWVVRGGALAIGLIAGALFIWAGRSPSAVVPAVAPPPGEPRWLKGQLHAHSSGSGDSQTAPEEVARWYAEHGYDFIVLTDHNRITRPPGRPDLLVLPGVELTVNLRSCSPPPEPGLSCLLHVNALAVENAAFERADFPLQTRDREAIYRHSLALTAQMGGVAQLNHPNMHYGASAELIATLASHGLSLMEIANVSEDSNDAGDARHPSTEALWDQLLTRGVTIYGTATDDAHHYWDAAEVRARGEPAFVGGRAFVRVWARNEAASIRAALAAGRFYASTGLELTTHAVKDGLLHLATDVEGTRFTFIGTDGAALRSATGRSAAFALTDARGGYVRAVVEDPAGRKVWTQPLRR